jgi:hypothetical protein
VASVCVSGTADEEFALQKSISKRLAKLPHGCAGKANRQKDLPPKRRGGVDRGARAEKPTPLLRNCPGKVARNS